MSRGLLLVLSLVALPPAARAGGDDEPDAPPLTGRPLNFSGAVGRFEIACRADPTEVHVEKPLTLTITVTAADKVPAPRPPRREALDGHSAGKSDWKLFPSGIENDFFIEPAPEKDVADPKRGKWEFVYRLRPKHLKATILPELEFSYYDPALRRYVLRRSGAEIELRVKEAETSEVVPPSSRVLELPARFYDLATGPAVLDRGRGPGVWAVVLLALAPPLLCWVGYALWCRLYPDAERQARRRRSRAARQALKSLAGLAGDDGAGAAAAVAQYLRARTDLPAREPTPAEVDRHLTRLGLTPEAAGRVSAFFRACDVARFAPVVAQNSALAVEGATVIELLEGELCPPRS